MKVYNTLTTRVIQEFVDKQLNRIGSTVNVQIHIHTAKNSKIENLVMERFLYTDKIALMHIHKKMFTILDNNELLACVAHELGHLFHHIHEKPMVKELTADKMSLRLGGNAIHLMSALAKITLGHEEYVNNDSDTHPSLRTRAANLKISHKDLDNILMSAMLNV